MSEQSAKPYLVRAICEWCADNGLTPYLAVKVDGRTRVPLAFVKNGEIVLNISVSATRRLTVDNEYVQFNARFNGVSQEIAVPMSQVCGIFAKETGYGFAFVVPVPGQVGAGLVVASPDVVGDGTATAVEPEHGTGRDTQVDGAVVDGNGGRPKPDEKPKARPSHLSIIK